jgi:hypothetical protein
VNFSASPRLRGGFDFCFSDDGRCRAMTAISFLRFLCPSVFQRFWVPDHARLRAITAFTAISLIRANPQ